VEVAVLEKETVVLGELMLDLEVSPPLYDGHHNTPRFGDVDTADLMINTMKRGFGHDDVAPKVR